MKEDELRDVLKRLFGEVDERIVQHHVNSNKHLKEGDNKIEVRFEGPAFSDVEVEEINQLLEEINYQFSYRDESQIAKAHYDYQDIIASIFVDYNVVETFKNGVVYPAIWDMFKLIVKKVFKRRDDLRELVKKKTVCISIEAKKNTSLKFLMEGDFTSEQIDKALDTAMEFSKTINLDTPKEPDTKYNHYYYVISEKGDIEHVE